MRRGPWRKVHIVGHALPGRLAARVARGSSEQDLARVRVVAFSFEHIHMRQ